MTQPKPGARDTRLQQLYRKRQQLDAQIKQTTVRRQRQQRREALERVLVYGRLVRMAGLDGTPPELLLGVLWESCAQPVDAARRAQWHTVGAALLAGDTRLQRTVQRLWPAPAPAAAPPEAPDALDPGAAGPQEPPDAGAPLGADPAGAPPR